MKYKSKKNKIILAAVCGILFIAFSIKECRDYLAPTTTFSASQKTDQESLYGLKVGTAETTPLPVKTGRTARVPILMYHHIGTPPPGASAVRKDLTVSPDDFGLQVKWLYEQNYKSISLKQLLDFKNGKAKLPEKPVVFTFDDGYKDVFDNAEPILKKYGFSGSFAIITDFPDRPEQGDNTYASWQQIAEAYRQGEEIVSHTSDHFDGKDKKYSQEFIFENLSGSREAIKNHLGFDTAILIYPYGHYTDGYISQAQKAGYQMGVTVHEGKIINLDNLMEVPRIRVHGSEILEKFKKLISE